MRQRRQVGRRWWRLALLAVALLVAVVELRGQVPSAAGVWAAVRQAGPAWLLTAAVLQVVSMAAFAGQQRHLLAAFEVRMPALAALAVSYTRMAMELALPGGAAVSAGYAYRQYRGRGAGQPVAAAVTALSGAASVVGLVLLYAGGTLTWAAPSWHTLAIVLALIGTVGLALRCTRRRTTPGILPPDQTGPRSLPRRLLGALRQTAALARTVSAPRWLGILGMATLNWAADLACLLAAQHAVGLTLPVRTVAAAYLAAQLLRQIPLTAGGIGVIEASLILAFTTAGTPAATATAAVLIYRLFSCWTILPIGLTYWASRNAPSATLNAAANAYEDTPRQPLGMST
jgi:uncharacterized protein (TIRG00374 family)